MIEASTWEQRPSLADVEAAVRTLIRWAGEDTAELLATTFEESSEFGAYAVA